jgi:hypothetical protein
MSKLLTAKRLGNDAALAQQYVKTHILLPASILGLICLVAGAGTIIYQFIASNYGGWTFLESMLLLILGGLIGWGQTRYQRFLYEAHPAVFANRMKSSSRPAHKQRKREPVQVSPVHQGQRLVPYLYALGVITIVACSTASWVHGYVEWVAALLIPWAGFFWAKLYAWRSVILLPT